MSEKQGSYEYEMEIDGKNINLKINTDSDETADYMKEFLISVLDTGE